MDFLLPPPMALSLSVFFAKHSPDLIGLERIRNCLLKVFTIPLETRGHLDSLIQRKEISHCQPPKTASTGMGAPQMLPNHPFSFPTPPQPQVMSSTQS